MVVFAGRGDLRAGRGMCPILGSVRHRAEWGKRSMWRDFAVITLANLASFVPAEVVLQLHLHHELPPSIEQFFH